MTLTPNDSSKAFVCRIGKEFRHGAGESVHWCRCLHTDLKKERKEKASLFVYRDDTSSTLVGSYEAKTRRCNSVEKVHACRHVHAS